MSGQPRPGLAWGLGRPDYSIQLLSVSVKEEEEEEEEVGCVCVCGRAERENVVRICAYVC